MPFTRKRKTEPDKLAHDDEHDPEADEDLPEHASPVTLLHRMR